MTTSSPTATASTGAASEATAAALEQFLPLFEQVRSLPQRDELRELRVRGWEQFVRQGIPTLRDEEWRFTNLAPLTKCAFARPQRAVDVESLAVAIAPFRLSGTVEIVFVDGRFVPELSDARLPEGISVETRGADGAAARRAGSAVGIETRPFAALASALFEEVIGVEIAARAVVAEPLHLLHYSTAQEVPGASFPRTSILAGERSQATVLESYCGAADAVYLTCPVTEIAAEPSSILEHYKFQRESRAAFHLSAQALVTERGATVSTHSFSLGGAIVRHDIQARLAGEGSEATLNGLYLVDGRQLCDTHMRVDHVAPHSASHELYKGILDGRSRAIFSGRIFVHEGAQKTDAKQTNRNLLLSDDALVNTHPQLEIFADDVKCTHGSTVGQLDDEAVFYLRSRGIGAEAAKSLLTYAFASDLVERAKVPALARELREFLFHWIPQGDVVRDAV